MSYEHFQKPDWGTCQQHFTHRHHTHYFFYIPTKTHNPSKKFFFSTYTRPTTQLLSCVLRLNFFFHTHNLFRKNYPEELQTQQITHLRKYTQNSTKITHKFKQSTTKHHKFERPLQTSRQRKSHLSHSSHSTWARGKTRGTQARQGKHYNHLSFPIMY